MFNIQNINNCTKFQKSKAKQEDSGGDVTLERRQVAQSKFPHVYGFYPQDRLRLVYTQGLKLQEKTQGPSAGGSREHSSGKL